MSITPNTIFKSTLAKIASSCVAVFLAGMWVNARVNSIVAEIASVRAATVALDAKIDEVDTRVQAVNKKLDTQFVTWPIARLYASETRRANLQLPLFLPDVDEYQKANRIQ